MTSTRHTSKVDFNGDGYADLLWRSAAGDYAIWNMSADGRSIINGGYIYDVNQMAGFSSAPGGATWGLQAVGDFNGDGTTDLLWQNDRSLAIQRIVNGAIASTEILPNYTSNRILGTADFTGDGKDDLFWRSSSQSADGSADGLWRSGDANARKVPSLGIGPLEDIPAGFQWAGTGDFNADGKDDLLFRNSGNASVGLFLLEIINSPSPPLDRSGMGSTRAYFGDPGSNYTIVKIADFNGDRHADILWQTPDGSVAMWLMRNNEIVDGAYLPKAVDGWKPIDAEDYNSDGKADILWQGPDGSLVEWLMDGTRFVSGGFYTPSLGGFWSPALL